MAEQRSVESLPWLKVAVPEGQRYSCSQCGECCRWWRIEVTRAERDRLLAHDWEAESPRLRGIKLFEETAPRGGWERRIQTAHLGGRCVFLEEDCLCLIHKVLGLEAKPAGCRRFPVRLTVTPDGILMGADYACRAVILNDGKPFDEAEKDIISQLPGQGLRMLQAAASETRTALVPGMIVPWTAYMEVESGLLQILGRTRYPVSARLAAADALLSAISTDWSGRHVVESESVRNWLNTEMELDYSRSFAASELSRSSGAWPVTRVAAAIGNIEVPHAPESPVGSAAIGYAMAVAAEEGVLYLSPLDATVDLNAVGQIACDMDAPEFDDCLTRFLTSYVMRKSLLESSDLKTGWEHLVTCFKLVHWYARASASLSERHQASLDDLVRGIQVVEKAYVP